jgi:hypothetical protein
MSVLKEVVIVTKKNYWCFAQETLIQVSISKAVLFIKTE